MAKKKSVTETEISKTTGIPVKGKGGRIRRTPDVGVWAIRGVDFETRSIIEKAASKQGKTIGQYVNENIRSMVQEQLSQKVVPSSPKDIQNQIDHLTQMVEGLVTRLPETGKKSLWEKLFG